jgi:hypothetical protein
MTTDRAALTAGYLDAVARGGGGRRELLSVMPATGPLPARYQMRYLSRPLFLGRAERDQLNDDLQLVRNALVSLPDRLFGGDLAAFARACGMSGGQLTAVLRGRGGQDGPVTQMVRADMYPEPGGLRLLELNLGSGVGGIDNGDFCRAMLRHPVLKAFARAHRLGYADTLRTQVRQIFAETGFAPGSYPSMALTAWPDWFARNAVFFRKIARRWRALGLNARACHIGQLKTRGGRVFLRGQPVDIIFRVFVLEHLLEPEGPALIGPLLDVAAGGGVRFYTPFDSELYGSKIALAMLSDDANRHHFSAAELAAFGRVLPWTRQVRPGPVTLDDGSTADLPGYALSHQRDLVLKPALLHGGIGVVPGWDTATTPRVWREALGQAMHGPFILQRRVRAESELCPGEDGEPEPWNVTWGVFTFADGFGGVFARGFPESSGHAIARQGTGLHVGCCLTG